MSGANTILAPAAVALGTDLAVVAAAALAAGLVVAGVRKGWQLLSDMFDVSVGGQGGDTSDYYAGEYGAGGDEYDPQGAYGVDLDAEGRVIDR